MVLRARRVSRVFKAFKAFRVSKELRVLLLRLQRHTFQLLHSRLIRLPQILYRVNLHSLIHRMLRMRTIQSCISGMDQSIFFRMTFPVPRVFRVSQVQRVLKERKALRAFKDCRASLGLRARRVFRVFRVLKALREFKVFRGDRELPVLRALLVALVHRAQ